jgi:serine-type D-Ala-D-Ala carboxypeptidase (penicillin-binding protein 5/6)
MTHHKEKSHTKKMDSSTKANVINGILVALPILLIFGYVYLLQLEKNLNANINKFHMVDSQISSPVSSYPEILNSYQPYITASSAIILDDQSQVPLYEKNTNLRFSMASTTKIMTALVAMEYYKDDVILTIQNDKVEGAEVGFKKGEQFKFIDVLYGMMLPSGNDAAQAIADNYPGGEEAFVARMNEKASQLHLYSTHYADPTGLNDDGNYTTAKDLARLASVALRNDQLRQIASTKDSKITSIDGKVTYNLSNLNKLLGYFGINGLKTGFTQGAGGVLVTSREEDGRTYIIVVIKSEDRFIDTLNLVSYMTGNVKLFTPHR